MGADYVSSACCAQGFGFGVLGLELREMSQNHYIFPNNDLSIPIAALLFIRPPPVQCVVRPRRSERTYRLKSHM